MADLKPLTDVVHAIGEGRSSLDGLLAQRDDMIRALLEAGVSYKDLTDATGLTRSALNKIRRGETRTG